MKNVWVWESWGESPELVGSAPDPQSGQLLIFESGCLEYVIKNPWLAVTLVNWWLGQLMFAWCTRFTRCMLICLHHFSVWWNWNLVSSMRWWDIMMTLHTCDALSACRYLYDDVFHTGQYSACGLWKGWLAKWWCFCSGVIWFDVGNLCVFSVT